MSLLCVYCCLYMKDNVCLLHFSALRHNYAECYYIVHVLVGVHVCVYALMLPLNLRGIGEFEHF